MTVTKLPRDERVPTRGQSTDGPIVMGLTHCDDGMEHAWSPGRTAAGRRPHPLDRVGAPWCPTRSSGPSRGVVDGLLATVWCACGGGYRQGLNLRAKTYGFRRPERVLRTFSAGQY